MPQLSFLGALAIVFSLSACTASTTLILLPDANGKVGAITVKTKDDSKLVNQAYDSVITTGSHLSEAALNKEDVDHRYADLLAAEPTPPIDFTLYFESSTTDLTEQSRLQLPQIIDRIKAKLPTEIKIIGHTDTTGIDSLNDKLSLQRARLVEKILTERVEGLSSITVRSFGSKDPLIPTPPNVDEPRNRRVEILIL